MHIFYKFLLSFGIVLLAMIGCTIDNPAEQITSEGNKINISFDREKFDFQKLHEMNDLDPIAIGDSLKVSLTKDTASIKFNNLIINQMSKNIIANHPADLVFDDHINIPEFTIPLTISDVPQNSAFAWALIDTGSFSISVENQYAGLEFKKIVFTLKTSSKQIIFKDSITNLGMTETKTTGNIPLDGKMLEEYMHLDVKITNKSRTADQNITGVSTSDFLNITYKLGDCTIHSARADFSAQKIINDSLYKIEVENIKLRSVQFKNSQVKLKAVNETEFILSLGVAIDALTNSLTGAKYHDKITLPPKEPNSPSIVLKNRIIDKWQLSLLDISPTEQGVFIKDTVVCSTTNSDGRVTYVKGQKALLIVTFTNYDPDNDTEGGSFTYWVDGEMDHKTLEINNEAEPVNEDIDWSNFEGISVDEFEAKLKLDINRDNLKLDSIQFKDFYVQGRKTLAHGGSHTEPILITIPPMSNVNDTTIYIDGLEPIINFNPDTLVFSGKAITSFDGILYDTDKIDMQLGFGVPLTIHTDLPVDSVALTQSSDVESVDAINNSDNIDIEAVKLNLDALINNPKGIDAKMRLTVKISDSIVKAFNAKDDSLAGNVKTLLTANIQKDFNGSTSYMISDLSGGKPVELDRAAITQMLKNKTYFQQTLEVISQGPNHTTTMKPEDFIEVQLKLSGELNFTYGNK